VVNVASPVVNLEERLPVSLVIRVFRLLKSVVDCVDSLETSVDTLEERFVSEVCTSRICWVKIPIEVARLVFKLDSPVVIRLDTLVKVVLF